MATNNPQDSCILTHTMQHGGWFAVNPVSNHLKEISQMLFPSSSPQSRFRALSTTEVYTSNLSNSVTYSRTEAPMENLETWQFRLDCMRMTMEPGLITCRKCKFRSWQIFDVVPEHGMCSSCKAIHDLGISTDTITYCSGSSSTTNWTALVDD